VAAVALDGRPLARSRRVLVTTCGRCENTGMQFTPDRRSVGTRWGDAPVQIEAVTGRLTLPGAGWRARALDPAGQPARAAPVERGPDACTLRLAPAAGTMWYLLTR